MSILAFDMYGTLVDPARQADVLRDYVRAPGELAGSWRRHQLEISWLLSLMDRYEDWNAVTAYALDAALAEAGVALERDRRQDLLARAAENHELFDEVPQALGELADQGFELAIFSNGAPDQLASVLRRAGIAERFSLVISVDEVGVFKPARVVYEHAARRLGRPLRSVWLVSANPFDAAGGAAAGMPVAKIERTSALRYGFAPPPDLVAADLMDLAHKLPSPRSPS